MPSMRVAVLGMGPVGLGSAALLASRGTHPVLWSPRHGGGSTSWKVVAEGAVQFSACLDVTAVCAEAVSAADAVLVAVPATAYRPVLDQLALVLKPGQPVLISGHLSYGALYLSKLMAQRGAPPPAIAAWGTTVVSGRRIAPGHVRVSSIRKEVDVAALPATEAKPLLALCQDLFGERFRERAGLLAVMLSNVNPQNHLAIALCNFTRIERAETWFQNTNITPSVGRLMEALDAERLAIAEAVGVQVRTLRQHFRLSFHVPEGPLGEMAHDLAAAGNDPAAPNSTDTRYVSEDAPFGLQPTVLLGRSCGRPARLHEAGLLTLSALYGKDLAAENDILPALGLDGLPLHDLRRLLRDGWPA